MELYGLALLIEKKYEMSMTGSSKSRKRIKQAPKLPPAKAPEKPKTKPSQQTVNDFGQLKEQDQLKLLFQVFPVETADIVNGDSSKNKIADAVMPVPSKTNK